MTTLFLATTGGHLQQLVEFAGRLGSEPQVWVTHENAQSRSLLADRDVRFVPYVRPHELGDVLRCLPDAHRLRRGSGLTRAVSTGSGIALGYLPYLAARGVDCHYIESAARVGGPSLTGRVLCRVPGVRTYTQYRRWATGRWTYAGSVFDRYSSVAEDRPLAGSLRVVVTVGTATDYPFRRMVESLVGLLRPGGALERELGVPVDVLWQTGCTPVADLPIDATPFLPAAELDAAMAAADVVVSHAGAGSALAAVRAGRAPVLIDRTARHGEAVDDHQAQLVAELVGRGLATAAGAPGPPDVATLLRARAVGVAAAGAPPPLQLQLR